MFHQGKCWKKRNQSTQTLGIRHFTFKFSRRSRYDSPKPETKIISKVIAILEFRKFVFK